MKYHNGRTVLKRAKAQAPKQWNAKIDIALAIFLGLMIAFYVGWLMGMEARAEGETVYVNTKSDDLCIRTDPDIHSQPRFWAEKGAELTVAEKGKYWWKVGRAGDFGYAQPKYLTDVPPPKPVKPLDLAVEWE